MKEHIIIDVLIPPLTRIRKILVQKWQIVYRVTRSPARLCSRDGKRCFNRRLGYGFLVFLPCSLLSFSSFSLSLSQCSSSSCFVRAAVICFSSASMCSYVICILSHLKVTILFVCLILFFVILILLVGVFVALSYPVRWH